MAVGSNGREEPVEVNRMLPKKSKTNILVDGGDPSGDASDQELNRVC